MKAVMGVALGLMLLALPALAAQTTFTVVPLDSDKAGTAPNVDPNLKNPWGISQAPGTILSVSNNATDTANFYDPNTGRPGTMPISIPLGGPTGQVQPLPGHGFVVSTNGQSLESAVIFATRAGAIEGWNPDLGVFSAVVAYQNPKADFTGLAYDEGTNQLFVADLAGNRIVVIDNKFKKAGVFTDPNLPKGYAPFDAMAADGKLYVTFALRKGNDVAKGSGAGYVDVFGTDGTLLSTLVAKGMLNAPWGMTIAPSTFGTFAGSLLVGNYGDGRINAFDPVTGALLGTLTTADGKSIELEGLKALQDATKYTGGTAIAFSAGPKKGKHGQLGLIAPN